MSARTLAAAAFAAMSLAGASPLAAADYDYPDQHTYTETERYSERVVHERVDRNDGYRDVAGYYDDRGGCLPRQAIRQRLRDDGWRDIQRVDVRGGSVILTAERPNGQLFNLKVDRCNGEIIDARKTNDGIYGEYRPRDRYYRD